MTVIAWDGHTLAADKLADTGLTRFTTTKVHRLRGHLVASTGDLDRIVELQAWFEAGAKPSEFPADCRKDDAPLMVVITPDLKVHAYQRSPYPMKFDGPTYAAGCGRDFALAAMHMGANARRAVEVASALSVGCGDGVDYLTFD